MQHTVHNSTQQIEAVYETHVPFVMCTTYSGGSEFTLKKHDINKVSPSVKYPIGYHTKNSKKQNTKVIDF